MPLRHLKRTIRNLLLLLCITVSYISHPAYAAQAIPKTINSNPASLYAPLLLPWQAALTSSNGTDVYCGAVVISEYWLITAAHCNKDHIEQVIAGISSIPQQYSQQLNPKNKFNITHKINHPNYNETIFANDIALIRVDRSLLTVAKPILITSIAEQQTADNIFSNQWVTYQNSDANLIASGWGKTNVESGINYPAQLQLITLAGVPDHLCRGLRAEHSHIVCADSNIDGLIKDVCSGDSGGPLIWQEPQKTADNDFGLRVIGITSNGAQCQDRLNDPTRQYQQLHGQYTELAPLRSWLEAYIKQYDNLSDFSLAIHNTAPDYKHDPFTVVDDYPQDQDINSLLVSTHSAAAGNIPLTTFAILIVIALSRRRINW
ncbi:S1 family serine peptidase [Photobacterium phosphoreum]|uniref:S1 family serine peptidase n=1 Tax=Photobacterium phosphoreum TaxID=659 RepID=UPI000D16C66A|nr:serine protease [Photobacterium phosphoreum]PSU63001.1 serine protease [Photobacterium phosphoreum]